MSRVDLEKIGPMMGESLMSRGDLEKWQCHIICHRLLFRPMSHVLFSPNVELRKRLTNMSLHLGAEGHKNDLMDQ